MANKNAGSQQTGLLESSILVCWKVANQFAGFQQTELGLWITCRPKPTSKFFSVSGSAF